MLDVRRHNREAWDAQVERGNPWTQAAVSPLEIAEARRPMAGACECVHFSHVRGERDIHRRQFESVMSRLAAMAAPGEAAFIGGDFNCALGPVDI